MPNELLGNVTLSYLSSYIDWSQNSGELVNRATDDPLVSHNPFKSNRQFIKLEQSFNKQLVNSSEIFGDQKEFSLREKMKNSAEALLDCLPDKISLRLTDEGSIFYTVIKGDLKVYLQHFLIDEFDESDEAILSIFQGDDNLLNYAGELSEVIVQFSTFFSSKNISVRQLA